ncbi:hypothetical protein HKX48_007690 [Thoreauomyces humboldtii]|nr:hypothetical protein HKX48_007690 [Thoreauomyces humboldtii]
MRRTFASTRRICARHSPRNHYKTLDVSPAVTKKELKAQFYKLSKKYPAYHPDKNPGNAEAHSKFVEISESYTVLSDPSQRRNHDQTLSSEQSPGSGTGSFGGNAGHRSRPRGQQQRTTRDPLRPEDWILFRRKAANRHAAGNGSPGFDHAKHQESHYPEAAEKREQARRSRLYKTLYFQKLQEAQAVESKMMAIVAITGMSIFFVFHSGLIQMIWMEDEAGDPDQADASIGRCRDFPILIDNP